MCVRVCLSVCLCMCTSVVRIPANSTSFGRSLRLFHFADIEISVFSASTILSSTQSSSFAVPSIMTISCQRSRLFPCTFASTTHFTSSHPPSLIVSPKSKKESLRRESGTESHRTKSHRTQSLRTKSNETKSHRTKSHNIKSGQHPTI